MRKFKVSRRMVFNIGLLFSLSAFTIHLQAQHGWTFNYADFENSGQVTAVVTFDGAVVTSGTLGAFVDNECRGFADALYFEPGDWYTFPLMIHSNLSSGEVITFRYYHPDDGLIYDVNETVVFVNNMNEGNSVEPLMFTVKASNDAPVVAAPIGDVSVDEKFGSTTIDLSAVFSDPDGDELVLSAVSGNTGVVTVAITGTTLTIAETGIGSSVITVTASDGAYSVDEAFTVTVNNVNEPPVVESPLDDLEFNEDFGTETVDLTGVFSDPDGDELVLTAVSSNTSVATVFLSGNMLTINEAGLGTLTITVTATDDGAPVLSTDETFAVRVINVNEAPVVANPIADRTYDERFATASVSLSGVFSDPDGDELVLSAVSGNTGVVTVAITGTTLTITETGIGSSVITVTASDGSLSVDDQFSVTVIDINVAPELTKPIPDQSIIDKVGSAELDLNEFFTDPFGDLLVYSVVLRNPGIVSYDLNESVLLLTPVDTGSTMVEITATDPEGLMATGSFMVYVEKEVLFIVQYGSRRLQNQDTIILCNDAGQITVKVITKARWGFTNNYLWMALEVVQDSALSVAFSPNLTGGDRIGDVTLSTAQGNILQFFVKQTEHCMTNVVSDDRRFDLKMYPNPVEDRLFINTGERLRSGMKVEVINQQGRQVFVEEMPGDTPVAPLEVDMRGYTAGLYYIRISGEGGSFTGKIVKK